MPTRFWHLQNPAVPSRVEAHSHLQFHFPHPGKSHQLLLAHAAPSDHWLRLQWYSSYEQIQPGLMFNQEMARRYQNSTDDLTKSSVRDVYENPGATLKSKEQVVVDLRMWMFIPKNGRCCPIPMFDLQPCDHPQRQLYSKPHSGYRVPGQYTLIQTFSPVGLSALWSTCSELNVVLCSVHEWFGGFYKWGYPKWMVCKGKSWKIQFKYDLGVPPFMETPISYDTNREVEAAFMLSTSRPRRNNSICRWYLQFTWRSHILQGKGKKKHELLGLHCWDQWFERSGPQQWANTYRMKIEKSRRCARHGVVCKASVISNLHWSSHPCRQRLRFGSAMSSKTTASATGSVQVSKEPTSILLGRGRAFATHPMRRKPVFPSRATVSWPQVHGFHGFHQATPMGSAPSPSPQARHVLGCERPKMQRSGNCRGNEPRGGHLLRTRAELSRPQGTNDHGSCLQQQVAL